jgi:hypothetical protein
MALYRSPLEVFMPHSPLSVTLGLVLAAIPLIANKNVTTHSALLHSNVPLAQKNEKKGRGNAPEVAGRPVLWEDRGDLSKLNLFFGVGSEEGQPKPPFKFDKEDVTGTNPKIKVIDANGVKWNIKFDEEVHSEVAASRIVWACGYMVEESYFVRSGKVEGVTKLTRARKFIAADGSFKDGMFEKRPDDVARRRNNWTWDANPFVGAKELSALQVLATMLNNWDMRPANNNVLGMYDNDDKVVDYYIVADWGASFGKMTSAIFTFSKWDLDEYAKQGFIDGVSGDRLKLHYRGKSQSLFKSVPIEHARWFAGIIGQLTDDQLRDAFRAGEATQQEVEGFTMRLRQKINELKAAVGVVN